MIWRFTNICYKSKEQQWKESKNETNKKNNKQKYMSKQLHWKTGIKDTNWKKRRRKSYTFVHVTKWSIQEKYDNKSIPRLWKLWEENKSKQQHTQMKIGKVEDSHDTWSAHGSSGCMLVTLCQATKSTYIHLIIYKINICAWNRNEVRCSEDHSAKHTCFSKRK